MIGKLLSFIPKPVKKAALGYGIYQAGQGLSSAMQEGSLGFKPSSAGGFWNTLPSMVGGIAGGGMMFSATTNATGRILRKIGQTTGSSSLRRAGRAIARFDSKRLLKIGGKQVGSAFLGVAKAPLMPVMDAINIGRRLTGKRFSSPNKVLDYFGESYGARALGWGALAGAGALAVKVNAPGHGKEEANFPLGGQQYYDPTSGRGPRRMDIMGNTDGLVQSLHKLR
jgi:hypothetical protein